MDGTLKKLLIGLLAAFALLGSAFPRAGGGVSVGRAAPSPARSAPSYSAPATPRYSAPAAPAPRAPAQPSQTTVIQQSTGGGGGGGGFGSSFLGGAAGAVVGNALSRPSGGVVAAPMAPVAGGIPGQSGVAPVAYVPVESSSGWAWFWFLILAAAVVAGLIWWFRRDKDQVAMATDEDFDPLHFFYRVQQAAMNDDIGALSQLCTRGMVDALSGNPEPDRVAKKTLVGVVHREYGDDSIEYTFTDKADGKRVTERWQLAGEKLAGIEVV